MVAALTVIVRLLAPCSQVSPIAFGAGCNEAKPIATFRGVSMVLGDGCKLALVTLRPVLMTLVVDGERIVSEARVNAKFVFAIYLRQTSRIGSSAAAAVGAIARYPTYLAVASAVT